MTRSAGGGVIDRQLDIEHVAEPEDEASVWAEVLAILLGEQREGEEAA